MHDNRHGKGGVKDGKDQGSRLGKTRNRMMKRDKVGDERGWD